MRQGLIALLIVSFGSVGCQTFSDRSETKVASTKKALKSSKRFPPLRDMESPESILSNHRELQNHIAEESTDLRGPVELTDKEKLFFELAGEKVEILDEVKTYQKAVEYYKQGDETALNAYANFLLKRYPKSIYSDNVVYLQGMLAFSNKNFGASLTHFHKILSLYPQSNKAVAALYSKGIVFKKMNLDKEAVKVLAQVINRYPGSPESAKAQIELKLITQ